MVKRNVARNTALLLLLFGVALAPASLHAASLYLDPPEKSYVVGEIFSITVLVSSEESINAVSGRVVVPAGTLEPISITLQNSVIDLWLQEPAVAANGDVVFEGLILGDGLIGVGEVFTMQFRVSAANDATLQFSEGLVLASDGLGTNILERIEGATLTFRTLEGRGGQEDLRELPETAPALATGVLPQGQLFAPTVIAYSERIASLNELRVRGVTYPEALVHVALQREGDETPEESIVMSDAGGNFNYRYQEGNSVALQAANMAAAIGGLLDPKVYFFWLQAEKDGLTSSPTQSFEVLVGGFDFRALFSESASVLVVTALIAILIIFIGFLGVYGWYYLQRFRKKLYKKKWEDKASMLY